MDHTSVSVNQFSSEDKGITCKEVTIELDMSTFDPKNIPPLIGIVSDQQRTMMGRSINKIDELIKNLNFDQLSGDETAANDTLAEIMKLTL